jgi:hypothetical protein
VPVTYQISGTITASGGGALAGVTMTPTGAAGATCNPSDAGGQFVCVVPQGVAGTLTITPSLGGYVFVPASRSYSNLTASSSGQNFTGSTSSVAVPGLPLWGQCLLAIALLGAALCRRGGFYRRE